MNTAITLTKTVASFAVSAGAGAIVSGALKTLAPANVSLLKKVVLTVGAAGLASAAGDVVSKHFEKQIDDVVEAVEFAKDNLKPNKKDKKTD